MEWESILYTWVSDWLSTSLQRVVINGEASDRIKVTIGASQGSELGPTLFTICMLYMISRADDTKLGGEILCAEDHSKIEENLNKVDKEKVTGMRNWLLLLNVEKVRLGTLTIKIEIFKYQIGYQKLSNVKQVCTYPGVISNC